MRVTGRRLPGTTVASAVTGPRAGRPAGYSLIEVLVSMFIVSMGVLALAGLMQAASRYGKMSELRATATLLADDLADRVRANPAGAALGADGYELAAPGWPAPAAAPHPACTRAAPCPPAELARADLSAWTTRLRLLLPDGSAYVKFRPATASAGRAMDVWVGWRDPNTLPSAVATERTAGECPPAWSATDASVRCVYLQVGF